MNSQDKLAEFRALREMVESPSDYRSPQDAGVLSLEWRELMDRFATPVFEAPRDAVLPTAEERAEMERALREDLRHYREQREGLR